MKVALVADLHFDSYHGMSRAHTSGMTTRLVDMLTAFRWALGEAVKAGCKRMILLGDIFDSRKSVEIPVIDGVCGALEEAAKKLELWVVVGNHDSFMRSPQLNSLQMFRGVAEVFDAPRAVDGFAMVPWYDDPAQIAEGVDKLLRGNAALHTLCTHGLVEGQHAGGSKGFPLTLLRSGKFKKVFLGDVHDPVVLRPNVQYVGSLMQIDYRDAGKKRGFVIYDTSTLAVKYIENNISPKYHLVAGAVETPVRSGDFVRVSGGGPGVHAEMRALTENVEIIEETVEAGETRLQVAPTADAAAILQRYVKHVLPEADAERVDSLVRIGQGYLETVR